LNGQKFNDKNVTHIEKDGLEYIQFNNLKKYEGIISHGFTTRIGGVSTGECRTLNLGYNKNDLRENVTENFKRIASALNINHENMVFSNQVHNNLIRVVDETDRGKGIIKKSDIVGYDGLLTNSNEVVLVTFYADCVPVFLFDPDKKAIATVHSGWRGTVKEIAGEAIKEMNRVYGCNAEDIEAAIGPSIGQCCFEVGNEVYNDFGDTLNWSKEYCTKKGNEKWNINLKQIIKRTLLNNGLREENICVGGICTKCNNDIFFSYRGDNGKTGSLAAIMQLNARPNI
jgi:polyphenol oxidase